MLGVIDAHYLLNEAQIRVAGENLKYITSQQEVMSGLGISESNLDLVEVNIT